MKRNFEGVLMKILRGTTLRYNMARECVSVRVCVRVRACVHAFVCV